MMRLSDAMVEHLRGLTDWPDLTGTRYEIRNIIGRGGMGTVYVALDHALEREVAIKVLSVEDHARAERMAREARILARLEHPGLVPVHDYGVLGDGRPYYVMKYVRGARLDEYAATAAESHEKLRIFLRICETIAFAHAAGVIHRDLKPENVMIGAFGEVLVLDWGTARVLGDPETTAATVVGTPGYMAPEQLDGHADLCDARTDIYALGAVLECLCSGEHPATDAIALSATAEHPDDRYQSVQALAADVARHLAGEPVSVYHEPLTERLARLAGKHAVALALVGAYMVMRVLLIAWR
ncbi:MAG TPA: serine/threonine-protein kinase [Gemmatimonadaceae bacterium]|jgi:serine/threonine protein kinase|nr:serine/threonine-protein kinase [Gemmatimonadaceae bacterium]